MTGGLNAEALTAGLVLSLICVVGIIAVLGWWQLGVAAKERAAAREVVERRLNNLELLAQDLLNSCQELERAATRIADATEETASNTRPGGSR